MLKVIIKALLVFWPFLKNIIFKDRTVREVIADNMQLTIIAGFMVIVSTTLYVTVSALADTKQLLSTALTEVTALRLEVARLKALTPPPDGELAPITYDAECASNSDKCNVVIYDKSHLIELLN